MAYDVSAFTDYVGRENDFLTATLFSGGDTGKFARFMTGVKGKDSIPRIDGDAVIQKGSCSKSASGDTDITEYFIEVQDWTYKELFCQDDLQKKFPNSVLAPGSNNQDTPAGWEEKVVDVKTASIQKQLELTYWQGDTGGTYTLFDGYIKKIDAAASAIDGNVDNVAANQAEVKATGTITLATSVAGDYVIVNGLTYTGVSGAKSDNSEYSIDTSDTAAALDLADSISSDARHGVYGYLTALSALGVVTVTSNLTGAEGNKVAMSTPDVTITLSGATLSGGIDESIGINKANVIDIVDGMLTVVPIDVAEAEDFAVFVGNDTFNLYIQAIKDANNYHFSAENDGDTYTINGSGVLLRKVRGLNGTDRIFACRGSFFVVGMDVEEESNVIKIWYSEDDDVVYFQTKAKSGVTPTHIEEIVEFTLV
jgi:hypothetical protein